MKNYIILSMIIAISGCNNHKKENLRAIEKHEIYSAELLQKNMINMNNSYLKLENLYNSNAGLLSLDKRDLEKELNKFVAEIRENITKYINSHNIKLQENYSYSNKLNFLIETNQNEDLTQLKIECEKIFDRYYDLKNEEMTNLAAKYNKLPKRILEKLSHGQILTEKELEMLMIRAKSNNEKITYRSKSNPDLENKLRDQEIDNNILHSLQKTSNEIEILLENDQNLVGKLLNEPKYIRAIANIDNLTDEQAIDKFKSLKKYGLDFDQKIHTGTTARNAIIFIISNSKINNSMKVRDFLRSSEI